MFDLGTLVNIVMFVIIAWFLVQRFLPVKGIKTIDTSELKKETKNKEVQFVDVRTPSEFKANHIKGFKNIPLSELHHRASELRKDKEVFVICQSGMRSNKASKVLKKLGFKHIINIKGGMSTWR